MFDIGFWELLVIAVVLLLVMGPERLPEVAKQAAFLIRKARQGMYRLRTEMRGEIVGTPFEDIQKARQEMTDLKKDLTQFGRELADSAESVKQSVNDLSLDSEPVITEDANPVSKKRGSKKAATKSSKKKASKKVAKKVAKKTAKKQANKQASP